MGTNVRVAWGRQRGIDIEATRSEPPDRLVIEAKGEATLQPQQVNYFLGALGELLQRMNDPNARYGLALPDNRQYRGLVQRLPTLVWTRLNLIVFFVRRLPDGYDVDVISGDSTHVACRGWQRLRSRPTPDHVAPRAANPSSWTILTNRRAGSTRRTPTTSADHTAWIDVDSTHH